MVLYYKFMIRDLVMHEIHSNKIFFAKQYDLWMSNSLSHSILPFNKLWQRNIILAPKNKYFRQPFCRKAHTHIHK